MRDFHTERMARALDTLKAAREYQGKRVTDTGARGWYPMTQYGCGGVDKVWDAQKLANVYTKSGLIWACIKEKASTLADLQLEVGMKNSDGTFEPIEDHELLELFYENPWYSFSQLIELYVARLDLTGASFNKKIEARGGMIGALAPLPTSVVEKVTKGLEIQGYRLGDDQQLTPPEEIMEHSYIAPGSYQCYVGPLQTVLSEILIDEEREKITKELLRNKNMPGYFLEPQDGNWTRDQIIQIKESMNAASGGDNESRGKGVALPKGAKVTMGPSVDDINYKELNSLTESRICMAFGVSPLIIQAKSGMDAGQSYNNYSNARKSFYEETILPLAAFFTDGFNRHLIPKGENLSFRFKTVDIVELQEDVNEVAKRSALLFEKGVATRDESREMVNLQPVEGDEGGFNKPPAPIMAEQTEDEPEEEGKVQGKTEEPEKDRAAIGSFDEAVELETTLIREFKRQEQEALDQLAETGGVDMATIGLGLGAAVESTLLNVADRNALKAIRKTHKAMGLPMTDEAIMGSFDVVQPNLEKRIREQAIQLSQSTMATTTKSLDATLTALREELIKEGVRGPNTVRALEEGVKRVFKNASNFRARQIAVTESSRAVNDASIITDSDTGLVQGFTPVISSDACELCQVYTPDGKATGIPRYPYTSTGDAKAQIGEYDNRTLPPYHPSCRCTLAPVFNDELPPMIKADGSVEGVGPYQGGGLDPEQVVSSGVPAGSPVKSRTDLGATGGVRPKEKPRPRPGGRPEKAKPKKQFVKEETTKAARPKKIKQKVTEKTQEYKQTKPKFKKKNQGVPVKTGAKPKSKAVKLTDSEKFAVKDYTGGDRFLGLNKKLRDGGAKLSSSEQRMVKDLDSALSKMKSTKGTTYRTLGGLSDKDIAAFAGEHGVGNVVSYSSFTSTTKDKGRAMFKGSGDVVLKIKGKSGRDVSGLSLNPGEQEVLFGRGARFRVESQYVDDLGALQIVMEEI